MTEARLVDDVLHTPRSRKEHEVRIAHIATKHGLTTVRSVLPEGAERELFVVGGLLSGANYPRFVGRAAAQGFNTRTIRHGNNSIHGAIQADADEVAASIEQLAEDRPVYITAHSKGGPVAIKAAARLDESVGLRELTLVNAAIGRSQLPTADECVGAAYEQLVCFGRMKNAARGVWHELTHRGLGVIGEIHDLFLGDDDLTEEMRILDRRGVYTALIQGTFDHIVPNASTHAAVSRLNFTEVRQATGPLDGSHFAILASDRFIQSLFPKAFAS